MYICQLLFLYKTFKYILQFQSNTFIYDQQQASLGNSSISQAFYLI